MSRPDLQAILTASPDERPAILEGRWLGRDEGQSLAAARPVSVLEGDANAFQSFAEWLARHAAQFPAGGAIGYLSYELASAFEDVPVRPSQDLPGFSFSYYDEIKRLPSQSVSPSRADSAASGSIVQDFDKELFMADIGRVRSYIAAGDIYQANLTQRFAARLDRLSPEVIYQRLAVGGAAMRAFLRTPQVAILSDSPERFFRVRGNHILASPIKGTVSRGCDPAEDEQRQRLLLASAKDRAENVMIVDLLRNDLGRICRYESIDSRLWEIDTMPQLFHLVSHVEGELRPEAGPVEIFRALFPCGSITGAPKIRAMEILSDIEPSPRGVSMGAIGIILGAPGSPRFEMDFNVAIRTITVRDNIAECNVGCGIVYDSEPEAEYEEMLLKAQPLIEALGLETPVAANCVRRPR